MLEYVRAYEGEDPYIFISYAHKDCEMVISIISKLFGYKYRIWYDEGISPGSEWPLNIANHLQKASLVIAFISKNSLASPNCENEIKFAFKKEKKIVTVCIDGVSRHPLLGSKKDFLYNDLLMDELVRSDYLSDELIGNGIDGYQYLIDKKRSFNTWNLLLGFAVMLAIVFTITIYGLYIGWFDNYFPETQQIIRTESPSVIQQETIAIDSNIIGSVLPVQFSTEKEKTAVYGKLGWSHPYEMTYKDLLGMDGITTLDIRNEPIYDIKFATYLPNLESINLYNSWVDDWRAPRKLCQFES